MARTLEAELQYPTIFTINVTTPNITSQNAADAQWDKELRVILLWIQIVIGTIGDCAVCSWLFVNRKQKSRVNVIMLHVMLSDLLVMGATLVEVIWETADRWWLAGDALCRIAKFFQSFSMMSSSFMMVLLSVDRHKAIRSPLRRPPAVWKMALPCWCLAALLSLPMFGLFQVVHLTDPSSVFNGMILCETVFRWMPKIPRQVFLTLISIVHVFAPCVVISVCYLRIFLKISEKAHLAGSTDSIRSNRSVTLCRAKVKTLKMTVVIVTLFIICGLPYHVLEMIYSFSDMSIVSPQVSAVLGALPVANSVVNPYIFLIFNTDKHCKGTRGSRPVTVRSGQLEHYLVQSVDAQTKYDSTKRSSIPLVTKIPRAY